MSATISVRLPDGRIVNNVPADISQEELTTRLWRNKVIDGDTAFKMFGDDDQVQSTGQRLDDMSDSMNIAERFLVGMGRGFTDFGEGVGQVARNVGESVGVLDQGYAQAFTDSANRERDAVTQGGALTQASGIVGRIAGNVAPALAVPVSAGTTLATRAGAGVASGGGLGALQFAPQEGDRLDNTIIGAVTGGALNAASPAIAEGVRRMWAGSEKTRQQMRQTLEAFRSIGARPSLGQASGSAAGRYTESVLRNFPGSSQVMAKRNEELAKALGTRVESITDTIAPGADSMRAGLAIQRGIAGFDDKFHDKSRRLFEAVKRYVPAETQTSVSATRAALDDMARPIQGAEATSTALTTPAIITARNNLIQDAGESGTMPFAALGDLRRQVGEKLTNPSFNEDIRRTELRRLYAAISHDMQSEAAKHGPQALQAYNRAQAFHRGGANRIDDFLGTLAKKADPDRLLNQLFNSGRQGATLVRSVRKSLNSSEWDVVASAMVSKLGKARPGFQNEVGDEFSAATFLTNWAALDARTRSAIFSDKKLEGVRRDLEKVATAAARMRDSARTLPNPSGTAQAVSNTIAVGGAVGGATTGNLPIVFGTVAAAKLFAKALHSPRLLNWFARSTEIAPASMPQHLQRLMKLAAISDPEVRESIFAFVDGVTQ